LTQTPSISGYAQMNESPGADKRSRILLADDEPMLRELGSRSLREGGYDVTLADDGWSAWREAQNSAFDLIITDHLMPHMTGAELIKRVRRVFPSLPIIMITGYFAEPDTPVGIPEDVTMIYKPFSGEALLAEVSRLLSMNGSSPAGDGDGDGS